jgi:hypothetical protein
LVLMERLCTVSGKCGVQGLSLLAHGTSRSPLAWLVCWDHEG